MPRPALGHVAEETRLAIPPDTEVSDVSAVGEPGIIEPHLLETPAKRAYLSGVFCALRKFRGLAAIMSIHLIASSNVIQVRRVGRRF
jgi:hypothetical protein